MTAAGVPVTGEGVVGRNATSSVLQSGTKSQFMRQMNDDGKCGWELVKKSVYRDSRLKFQGAALSYRLAGCRRCFRGCASEMNDNGNSKLYFGLKLFADVDHLVMRLIYGASNLACQLCFSNASCSEFVDSVL